MCELSYQIIISSEHESDVPPAETKVRDNQSCRWFASFGCGFRFYEDAYFALSEDREILSSFYQANCDCDRRESLTSVWPLDDKGEEYIVSCDLTEYFEGERGLAKLHISEANTQAIEKLTAAIKEWHITGGFTWEGLDVEVVPVPNTK